MYEKKEIHIFLVVDVAVMLSQTGLQSLCRDIVTKRMIGFSTSCYHKSQTCEADACAKKKEREIFSGAV